MKKFNLTYLIIGALIVFAIIAATPAITGKSGAVLLGSYGDECTDTDGGKDAYSPGYTEDIYDSSGADRCIDESTLLEFYCSGVDVLESEEIQCEYGCEINHCLESEPAIEAECTDSDGGKYEFKYGYTSDKYGIAKSDTCKDSQTLYEFYCSNLDEVAMEEISCKHGCIAGRCEESTRLEDEEAASTPSDCYDSDGGIDEFRTGFAEDVYGIHELDRCEDDIVIEFYCSTFGEVAAEEIQCKYGCDAGHCIDSASAGKSCEDYCNLCELCKAQKK